MPLAPDSVHATGSSGQTRSNCDTVVGLIAGATGADTVIAGATGADTVIAGATGADTRRWSA